jgi:hypothetical protein
MTKLAPMPSLRQPMVIVPAAMTAACPCQGFSMDGILDTPLLLSAGVDYRMLRVLREADGWEAAEVEAESAEIDRSKVDSCYSG